MSEEESSQQIKPNPEDTKVEGQNLEEKLEESPPEEQQKEEEKCAKIFSFKGTPTSRIQRHNRDSSSVFPIGCMGCKEPEADEIKSATSPRRFIDAHDAKNFNVGHMENLPRKRPQSGQQDCKSRNPLTGEGITSSDHLVRTHERKREGNPVTGLGYENDRTQLLANANRIPPGGFSKGLW